MFSKRLLAVSTLFCLCSSLAAAAADTKTTQVSLTAAQIVEKYVAARGGLQAWRAVQAMSWTGKLDAGGGSVERSRRYVAESGKGHASKVVLASSKEGGTKAEADTQVQLPFVLEMKRPNKSRVEVVFAGKTAVQVYDGTNGWKVRPYLNRTDAEPFTPDELKSEAGRAALDGPLIDYAAKGSKVDLEGVEPVAGRDAYKLKLTTKNGDVQHIWIDTGSYLDVKVEGTPRRMDGKMRNVWIYQRDFRSVQGVMVPFILETAVDGYKDTHSMVIEKVAVNPNLQDSLFAKPKV
jgi:hypothetical protein